MSAIGLAMKFTADTGGIKQGAAETSKLLNGLSKDVSRAQATFSQFSSSNNAAATAQQQLATDASFLASALRTGQISAEQFKAELAGLSAAASQQAGAFQEGAALTEQYTSAEQKRAAELERLSQLLDAGAISQDTYSAAVYDASGAAKEAEAAEASKAKAMSRGESITKGLQTEEEKYADTVAELEDLLQKGAISQQTFNRAMDKAEGELGGVEKGAHDASGALNKMTGYLKIIAAIEIGRVLVDAFRSITSAVGNMIGSIRSAVDETAKLAAQTGIAVEALQVFQLAAQMSGVDNLVEPIRKLGIEIGNAAQSGNIEKFERLGLNFDQLSRMAPEEQFKQIAAAIAALPTPAERAAAAVAIFGEQGVKMLPLFEQNLAAIEERMQRLGIVLSEDQTGAIEEMNDSLLLVQKTFEGIIGQVTANLAPVVSALAEDFLSFIESYQGLGDGTGGTALADSITEALFDGAEYLADLLDYAIANLNDWGVSVESTFAGLEGAFQFFADAVTFLNDAFFTVRSTFNDFLAGFAEVASKFVAYFSSAGAEFLDAFAQNLRASAEQDRQQRSGPERAEPQQQEEGTFGGAVREGRRRREGRNSPEAVAEREAKAAERQANRDAAAAAKEEAERKKQEEKAAEERRKAQEAEDKMKNDLQADYNKKAFDYESNRLDKLSEVNTKALEQSDIRSGGISQVLAMATGREDPAVTESRKQLKELQELRRAVQFLGGTVEIVGAA